MEATNEDMAWAQALLKTLLRSCCESIAHHFIALACGLVDGEEWL